MSDLLAEAEARYRAAARRRAAIAKAWRAEGSPLLGRGSQGQQIEHALVKMLREHDVLLSKLAVPLKKTHAGPDPSAVVRPLHRITRRP